MNCREIKPQDDAALAALIRSCLKSHRLDIPGTAYFDRHLDHLSDYYLSQPEKRAYYILSDENNQVLGGVGLAELEPMPGCAELQKLYLSEQVQGSGIGYQLLQIAEDRARALGYQKMYLETHTNLEAAIYIYIKIGYCQIPKPEFVVHSTMNRFFLKSLI